MSYLDDFCEKSKSEMIKSAVAKLSNKEKTQFGMAINKIIHQNAADATIAARRIAQDLSNARSEINSLNAGWNGAENRVYRYKGFYDTIIEPERIEYGGGDHKSLDEFDMFSVKDSYLKGVREAVDYITNRPDQIIQHLQDPNPKDKDVNINYRNRNRKDSEL